MNITPPRHYVAEAKSIGCFSIQLAVHLNSHNHWQSRADFEIHATSTESAKILSQLSPTERPLFRAWYIDRNRELHIEEIRRNCLLRGQGFANWVFESFCQLVPSAMTIYLANVTHPPTANLIQKALSTNPLAELDNEPNPGPLIKALLSSGFRNVLPVREGHSAYIGLRATVSKH